MIEVFAPGRVELLGNHTDYNGGVVLSAALDLGVRIAGEARAGIGVSLESEGFGAVDVPDPLAAQPRGDWSDYVIGVVQAVAGSGRKTGGFRAAVSSDLPTGAGLSSSAAIEVATVALLRELFGLDLRPMDGARLARQAENQFVGVQCGLLDQVSSMFGRAGHAVYLDCRAETVDRIPFPPGHALLVIDSGAKHALTGGEYNERRDQCFEAARLLGVEALRDASTADLEAAALPDLVHRRAAHVIGENERVFEARDALERGDAARFGALMFASHESSRTNFENSTPELDLLVELAAAQTGVLGARLTGGGFGGAIVALVRDDASETAAASIVDAYRSRTGIQTSAIDCGIGDGAAWPDR